MKEMLHSNYSDTVEGQPILQVGGFVMSHVGCDSSTATVVTMKMKYRTAMHAPKVFCSFQPLNLMLQTVPKTIPRRRHV